jgi:hypothetical protein
MYKIHYKLVLKKNVKKINTLKKTRSARELHCSLFF